MHLAQEGTVVYVGLDQRFCCPGQRCSDTVRGISAIVELLLQPSSESSIILDGRLGPRRRRRSSLINDDIVIVRRSAWACRWLRCLRQVCPAIFKVKLHRLLDIEVCDLQILSRKLRSRARDLRELGYQISVHGCWSTKEVFGKVDLVSAPD